MQCQWNTERISHFHQGSQHQESRYTKNWGITTEARHGAHVKPLQSCSRTLPRITTGGSWTRTKTPISTTLKKSWYFPALGKSLIPVNYCNKRFTINVMCLLRSSWESKCEDISLLFSSPVIVNVNVRRHNVRRFFSALVIMKMKLWRHSKFFLSSGHCHCPVQSLQKR